MESNLKKDLLKFDLLTDIDLLLMLEKGIRGGIYHTNHRYAKANNKYMKVYDKNKESSYLQYWDVNSLYGWRVSQKLPVNGFRWLENASHFNQNFIKSCNEDSDEGHNLQNDLLFSPEKVRIEKIDKVVTNLHDKNEYVSHIRKLKQALNYWLVVKRVHRVIKLNQKAQLKSDIDMNKGLRMKKKNDYEKDFFKPMNNAVFGKTMENIRNHRDIKLVTTKTRRNYLV